jgi:hypothetical protein
MSFIDDQWFEHATKGDVLGVICINAAASEDGKRLIFVAQRMLHIESKGENVTLEVETFGSAQFSAWFTQKIAEGWRVCR